MRRRQSIFIISLLIIYLLIYLFTALILDNINKEKDIFIFVKDMYIMEIETPIFIEPIKLKDTEDKKELKKLMNECLKYKEILISLIPNKNSINYTSHRNIINKEISNVNMVYQIYKYRFNYKPLKFKIQDNKLKEIIKTQQVEQKHEFKPKQSNNYKNATIIWNYLKNNGFNDYVSAGILGNIMAEVGGHTLNIQPNLYSKNKCYYGICQWSIRYYPQAKGLNLNDQLNLLISTIKKEFNEDGYYYKKNFNYNSFLNIQNSEEAALAFARIYEKCSSRTYSLRQKNAKIAYNYFVN